MDILELQSISFGYAKNKVIDAMSFAVNEGEFLGIIGPNGAGKTTLFKLILGLYKPWDGDVFFKNEPVSHIPRYRFAQNVAAMTQLADTQFSFSVEDFVLMGRYPHLKRFETPKERDVKVIEESLSVTDTAHLKDRNINELSGGEKQRVLLAQALAQEPKLLLLDEPTAYLDITHQVSILDLIKRLNKSLNLTVIIVLHDLNLAAEYCDRLILINNGRVYKTGTPWEVLEYKNIEEVYKTVVVVKENPVTKKPHVLIVPEQARKSREQ
ncbi:MAG: ABC transporter ATP-binding protein [Elusimicrobia bacterium]|nr:ABC transporter ATP-binding protein [Candidatus Liberimonas magnetica]